MGKELPNVAPSGSSKRSCRCWTATSRRRLAALAAAATLLTGCSSAANRARRHVDAGNRDFDAQKYRDAVIEYRTAIQADPRLAEAHRMLAQAYAELHDRGQSARELVRAADLLPRDTDLQIKAATALLELQQFKEARERVEAVLRQDSANVPARLLLGYALAGLQNVPGAVAQLDESLSTHGGDARTYTNLGVLQLATGQQRDAEKAFTMALALAPKSAHVHLAMAQFDWATSRRAEAEQEAKRALELDPLNRDAHWLLAAMYVATHRDRDAEAHLKAAAEGNAAAPRFVLADYYVATHRIDDARAILVKLATDDRYYAPATRRLARAEQAAGRPARAEELVDELLARVPNDPAALTMKVRYLLAARKLDDALSQLRSATANAPKWAEGQELLGDTYASKGDVEHAMASFRQVLRLDPNATSARVDLAGLYLFTGAADQAIAELCRALDRRPGDESARLMLARAFAAKGDLAAAKTELETLPATGRFAVEVQTELGSVLIGLGRSDAASRAFARALEQDPEAIDALAGLVVVKLREKNVNEARRIIESRLADAPDSADLLLLAARTYAAIGDAFDTERMFRRALERDPANLEATEQFGRFYVAIGRWHEAEEQFKQVVARSPRSVYAQTMIAAVLQAEQKPADARAQYEKVLSLDPKAAIAANNLAWQYLESGTSLDAALRLARLAASQIGDRPETNDTLGWVYCAIGRSKDAIPLLETSVRLDPSRAVYHYHLGVAYQHAGDAVLARRSFERALQRNPKLEPAREALRALAPMVPAS